MPDVPRDEQKTDIEPNSPITEDARKAVPRLTNSHQNRDWAVAMIVRGQSELNAIPSSAYSAAIPSVHMLIPYLAIV